MRALHQSDSQNPRFLKLLCGIWFYLWELPHAYHSPDFHGDLKAAGQFDRYYTDLIKQWEKEKRQRYTFTDYTRDEVRKILIEMGIPYFTLEGTRLEREAGRPEWSVNGFAIEKALEANPHDQKALDQLFSLFLTLDSYSWASTSYVLSEELGIFGKLIANLDFGVIFK